MAIRTQLMDGYVNANAEKIFTLEDMNNDSFTKLSFQIPKEMSNKDCYKQLLDVLKRSPGQTSFTISVITEDNRKAILKPSANYKVALTPSLIKDWEKICGKNSLKIVFPNLDSLVQQRGGFKRKLAYAK